VLEQPQNIPKNDAGGRQENHQRPAGIQSNLLKGRAAEKKQRSKQ
jgi:hypothetical protein